MPSGLSAERLVDWLRRRRVRLGGVETPFRDREAESVKIIDDLATHGARALYGPLGAGKSTLLRLVAEGIEELGPADSMAIYVDHGERALRPVAGGVPPGEKDDLARRVRAILGLGLEAAGQPLAVLGNAVAELAELVGRYARAWGKENVLIIHDDLDKATHIAGYDHVADAVGVYAGMLKHGRWGDRHVKVHIALSDWTAVESAKRGQGRPGGHAPLEPPPRRVPRLSRRGGRRRTHTPLATPRRQPQRTHTGSHPTTAGTWRAGLALR